MELSELQLRQTQNEVTLTVDQYYWNIVVLNEKLKTLQHVSALLEKICSDAKAAVDAGIKNRNDLLQVHLSFLNKKKPQKIGAYGGGCGIRTHVP